MTVMMSLRLRWYDATCFAIVAAAIVTSLWLLLQRQAKHQRRRRQHQHRHQSQYQYEYESLVPLTDDTRLMPDSSDAAYVASDCLWRSAWLGVHPAVLLVVRLAAAALLTAALLWDLRKYDCTIFVYYTE